MSSNSFYRIKTPLKIIISGEHAVIYDNIAIACAINLYSEGFFNVIYETQNNFGNIKGEPLYELDMKLKISDSIGNNIIIDQQYSNAFKAINNADDLEANAYILAFEKMYQFILSLKLKQEKQNISCTKKYSIGIKGEVNIDAPFGSGLGTSASVLATCAKCLFNILFGEEFNKNNKYLYNELFKAVQIGETIIHGKASGIDAFTVIFTGICLSFPNNDLERKKKFVRILESANFMIINDVKTFFQVSNTNYNFLANELLLNGFYIKWTGVRKDSAKLITKVSKMDQELKKQYFTKIGEVSDSIFARLFKYSDNGYTNGADVIGIKELEDAELEFNNMINLNHDLLCKIGVSIEEIELAIKHLKDIGCCSSKLSGSGGGGCVIGFSLQKKKLSDKKRLKIIDTNEILCSILIE